MTSGIYRIDYIALSKVIYVGYTKDINHMKMALPEDKFLEWCRLIVINKGLV